MNAETPRNRVQRSFPLPSGRGLGRGLLALVATLATAALAGPYDQPYGIIATDRKPAADYLLLPVIVNRVDDENAMNNNTAVVAPGIRKVTIDVPPRRGFHLATQVTFDLDVKPCVRYNLAARLENSIGQSWKPVVRSEEALGDCGSKFKIQPAASTVAMREIAR
jgi:hypothetical protein